MTDRFQKSRALFERAQRSIAGGINSGIRKMEQPVPLYFSHGRGCRLFDLDDNEYIDFQIVQGAILLDSNLVNANLQGTNLRLVDLTAAILVGTNLQGANLQGAMLAVNGRAPNGGERIYFYYAGHGLGSRVSEQAVQSSWNLAAGASPTASLACVPTWHEDFRKDLSKIDVPTLVLHGDADRILPIAASGFRTANLIQGARLVVVKDGPHCITWTHAEEVNSELVNFLGKGVALPAASNAFCLNASSSTAGALILTGNVCRTFAPCFSTSTKRSGMKPSLRGSYGLSRSPNVRRQRASSPSPLATRMIPSP